MHKTYTHAWTYTQVHTHASTHKHIGTHTQVHMHAHTHRHTDTFTHIQMCLCARAHTDWCYTNKVFPQICLVTLWNSVTKVSQGINPSSKSSLKFESVPHCVEMAFLPFLDGAFLQEPYLLLGSKVPILTCLTESPMALEVKSGDSL